jgi:hypothetical protein
MMTPDEKLELVELLEYRTRSSFIIRRERSQRKCGLTCGKMGVSLATVLQNWLRKRATQVFSDSSCLGWSEAQTGMPLCKIIGATAASNTL